MKKTAFVAVIVAFTASLVIVSTDASANKYKKMQYQPHEQETSDVASAEKNRSMMDCMQFSANFKSEGINKDKAAFDRQFGGTMSEAGRTLTYSYDTYTTIILDCSKGGCYCKCLGK